MLLRARFPGNDPSLVYLDVPLLIRAPIAVAVIAWGAWTDRRWTIPVAMTLAMPIVWANSFTILVALLPMLAPGRAPLLSGGQWLRSGRGARQRLGWVGGVGAARTGVSGAPPGRLARMGVFLRLATLVGLTARLDQLDIEPTQATELERSRTDQVAPATPSAVEIVEPAHLRSGARRRPAPESPPASG
jgi:hypothetical protein